LYFQAKKAWRGDREPSSGKALGLTVQLKKMLRTLMIKNANFLKVPGMESVIF
jgi:hypothetical protein